MVFHKHHPNDFCRPPPLRTIMGRPPTTPIGTRRALVQLGCIYSCHIPLLWSFTSTTQMIFAGHHHCAPSWVARRQPPIGTRRALVQLGCKYSCHIPLLWSFTSTTQMIFAGHHHCAPSWVARRQPPIGTRRALVQLGCKYSCHIPLLWSFTSTTQMIFAGHHHCAPSWVARRQPPSVRAGRWFNWDAILYVQLLMCVCVSVCVACVGGLHVVLFNHVDM